MPKRKLATVTDTREPSSGQLERCMKLVVLTALLLAFMPGSLLAQMDMNMNPYFSTINYPLEEHSVMVMALPDFQVAQYGPNFVTGMVMAEYGITSRWTAGLMAEGQKISGLPATYGGMRLNTYFHLFRDERWLNLTLYGEFEDLNGAALYKMEVAGFGPEDLMEPLAEARRTPVRTFEQRAIVYHDSGRFNATINFIRETALQSPRGNDYGYAMGVFVRPSTMSGAKTEMGSMPGMKSEAAPPPMSFMSRVGYGLEMFGALGDDDRFGIYRNEQQHYIGPVFSYALSSKWSLHLEPSFGLSRMSDPFVLRTGIAYTFGPRGHGAKSGPAPM